MLHLCPCCSCASRTDQPRHTAATRVYVHESRQQDVTDALVESFKQVKVGDRLEITWTEAILVAAEAPKK